MTKQRFLYKLHESGNFLHESGNFLYKGLKLKITYLYF